VHCFSRICFNDCDTSAVRYVVPTANLFKAVSLLNGSIIIRRHATKSSKCFHLLPVVNFPLDQKQHFPSLSFVRALVRTLIWKPVLILLPEF